VESRLLQDALSDFAQEVADALQAELQAGAEIPFELAGGGAGRRGRPGLQLYSPMSGAFVAQRWAQLSRLPSHAQALRALQDFRGLDRYLATLKLGAGMRSPSGGGPAGRALQAFAQEVFAEQSDFVVREGRLQEALRRLTAAAAAAATPGSLTIVASVHGLAILSEQVQLAERLTIARPQALSGVPEQVLWPEREGAHGSADGAEHLLVVLDVPEQERIDQTLAYGKELLRELLRALRLYGDGRIAFGSLAWASAGDGPFAPVALSLGGHPQGVLVVSAEQEDELRAFCSLLARRMPREGALAFALRRFELGCERPSEIEGLSDHLLALQALLEPERGAHGLLASRIAALCAPVESRQHVAARVLRAIELERDLVRGEAAQGGPAVELAREIAGHLRALLRDAICGHLAPDLVVLADEMALQGRQEPPPEPTPEGEKTTRIVRARRGRAPAAKASATKARSQDALPI
jgi:hypothetical protein